MKLEMSMWKKKQIFVIADSMLANFQWMYLGIILLRIPDIAKLILMQTIRKLLMIARGLGRKFQ